MHLRFDAAMRRVQTSVEKLAARNAPEAEENSQYAIPLAFKKRALFKMDFAEAVYISELRTTPGRTCFLPQCGLRDV